MRIFSALSCLACFTLFAGVAHASEPPAAVPVRMACVTYGPCKCCAKCECEKGKLCDNPKCDCECLSGIYQLRAEQPDGAAWGVTTIVKTECDGVYLVRSLVGAEVFSGIGIRKGNSFAVVWRNGETAGMSVYEIRGREMHGHWTTLGPAGDLQCERLRRLGPVED